MTGIEQGKSPEMPNLEFITKEEALAFLYEQTNNWNFAEKTDKENIWFTYNTVRWIVENFAFPEPDWVQHKHVAEVTVDGERLPEILKPFVMTLDKDTIEYTNGNEIVTYASTESSIFEDGETDKELVAGVVTDEQIDELFNRSDIAKPKWLVWDVVEVRVNLARAGFVFNVTNRNIDMEFSCEMGVNRDIIDFVRDNEKNIGLLCQCALNLTVLNAEYCKDYCINKNGIPSSSIDEYGAWMSHEKVPPKDLRGLADNLGTDYIVLRTRLLDSRLRDDFSIDDKDIIEI